MKGFLTGLFFCLLYAVCCVFILSYTFDTVVPNISSSQEIVAETPTGISKATQIDSNDQVAQPVIDEPLADEKMDPAAQDLLEQMKEPADGLSTTVDKTTLSSLSTDIANSDIAKTSFSIILPDGENLLSCNSYATVFKDRNQVKIPYDCRDYGIVLKSYLEKNEKSTLKITGISDPSEDYAIGKQRATYLKDLLVNIGVSKDRILVAQAISLLNFTAGSANGGILMKIEDFSSKARLSTNERSAIQETNTPSTRTKALISQRFTSGFQGDYYYGDQKFTSFITTVKELLKKYPEAKVYAYSYTKSTGSAEDNFAISRDNASTVRKLMIQGGVIAGKIKAMARGGKSSGSSGNEPSIVIVVK